MFATSDQPFEWSLNSTAALARTALSGANEAELSREAALLREDAWAEIYRRHAQQVFAYIYYRLGDHDVAEDLTADVFVRALAGIKGYSYRGTPLLAWLYRISHNVTVDHRKSAAKRSQHQSTDAAGDIEQHPQHPQGLQALDDRRDMMAAIRQLTEDQQQVIILRFYHGLSNADVAKVVGKPESAVKALQGRALRSLRRFLGEPERKKEPA